jgi:hypothetical protein
MSTGSKAKQQSTRGKNAGPKLWIAECTLEQTAMPNHVNVCFALLSGSDRGESRSAARRFLLHRDQVVLLIDELKEALGDVAAVECIEKQTSPLAVKAIKQPVSYPDHADVDDTEPLSDHFALGTYGLVGN